MRMRSMRWNPVELWRCSRINCYNGRKTDRSYEVYYRGSSQFARQTAACAEINLCAGKCQVRKSTLTTRCIGSKCISKPNARQTLSYRATNWTIIFNIKLHIVKAVSGLEIEGASCFDTWRDLHYRALIKRTDFNCCVITGWLSFTGIQCAHL